ncbi:BA75_03796T0 [Komagataella pastoris]|uniref:BA75_03796T0 n=1 Tax=Komagataella pastoris TaxID=4922 RepID=A0A1B2JGH4_PICPA|nr:BA75_03796T0 [Komagataella pastoris]
MLEVLKGFKYESLSEGKFSPSRIFSQIVILQLVYYVIAFILFYFTASLAGFQFSLQWIFSWELVTSGNTLGWTLFFLWLFDSLLCVVFMMWIVGRSKLAWDFAITIHLINFLVCWLYSGKIPASVLWWFLQLLSSTILVSLGTWSTRWQELRDTFFEGLIEPGATSGDGDPELGISTELTDLPPK